MFRTRCNVENHANKFIWRTDCARDSNRRVYTSECIDCRRWWHTPVRCTKWRRRAGIPKSHRLDLSLCWQVGNQPVTSNYFVVDCHSTYYCAICFARLLFAKWIATGIWKSSNLINSKWHLDAHRKHRLLAIVLFHFIELCFGSAVFNE